MWLFTEDGFFSAVLEERGKHAGRIAIRARCRDDLVRLVEKYGGDMPNATAISETPKNVVADYRYRIWLPRGEFALVCAEVALAVEYGNFKSRVAQVLGPDREKPLHEIWSVMAELQPGGPYGWHERRQPFDWSGIDHLDFDPTPEDGGDVLAFVRPHLRGGKTVRGYKQRRKRRKRNRKGK